MARLNVEEAKSSALIAPDYEIDEDGLLFFCPSSVSKSNDRTELIRLVVPELLQQDFLHHYHASLEGGHQGIARTYQRIREFSLERSVQKCTTLCGRVY